MACFVQMRLFGLCPWLVDYSKPLVEDKGCFPSLLPHSLASVPCVSMGLQPGGFQDTFIPTILSHPQHAPRPGSEATLVTTPVLPQP